MKTAARMTVLPLALVALSGCAGPLNTESKIGTGSQAWTPPSIGESSLNTPNPEVLGATTYADAPVYTATGIVTVPDAERSVLTLDRTNWEDSVVAVPNDLTAHQPRFTNNILVPENTRRARGQFPSAQSALDTGTSQGNDLQAQEALFAPFAAAGDVVLFIPRFVAESRPYRPTRTGTTPYQRAPVQNTVVLPPVTPVGPARSPLPGPQSPPAPTPEDARVPANEADPLPVSPEPAPQTPGAKP